MEIANNITICIPKAKNQVLCDKNCPYCVSKMSFSVEHDYDMMQRNFPKLKRVATNSQTTNLLITGKGEPLLNFDGIGNICTAFKDYPTEIQTNGIWLRDNLEAVKTLKRFGVDTIAISIDEMTFIDELVDVFETIRSANLTTRICINVTDKLNEYYSFDRIMHIVKRYKIDQLLFRNVSVPNVVEDNGESKRAIEWIQKHVQKSRYNVLYAELSSSIYRVEKMRSLPHGVIVWDVDRVSVTFSDYCIQEYNKGDDIRSYIMLPDGHVYTNWDKISSRIF
jgi:organic radical activating enzyme